MASDTERAADTLDLWGVECPECGILETYTPSAWRTASEHAGQALGGFRSGTEHDGHGELTVRPVGAIEVEGLPP